VANDKISVILNYNGITASAVPSADKTFTDAAALTNGIADVTGSASYTVTQ